MREIQLDPGSQRAGLLGVLEFEGTDGRAGYSLVLDEIRETGYAGTELGDWGFLPTDPAELRSELGRRELALLGAFVPVALARSAQPCSGAGGGLAGRPSD